jgi:hypothetical protein
MNAVLPFPLLVFLIRIGSDADVVGEHGNGLRGAALALAAAAVVGLSPVALVAASIS